ncbi:hypothetical protein NDI56_21030 [Haloarcula sp. S1CR25-12]|uniref:Uncharacterized protein n=1 Tax=Haloarcula saliterrae TaxID=2950534 RepID=A0ABU2FI11_9EURY|nr:hypothetical protein [Haloarcula sp. S1CR25-12]MDS0261893.1 hypothetical protein [Haloarcula sp. S1CR25-12]
MSDDARELVKEMLLEHRGADSPISSREISERLEENEVGSFPKTRMMIREIMLEDQIPIASSNNGYYVIESEEELQDYIDQLENRILGISERKFGVQRAADQWDGEIETDDDLDLL